MDTITIPETEDYPKACPTCEGDLEQTGMFWAAGAATYVCTPCGQEIVRRLPSPLQMGDHRVTTRTLRDVRVTKQGDQPADTINSSPPPPRLRPCAGPLTREWLITTLRAIANDHSGGEAEGHRGRPVR